MDLSADRFVVMNALVRYTVQGSLNCLYQTKFCKKKREYIYIYLVGLSRRVIAFHKKHTCPSVATLIRKMYFV